MGYQFKVHPHQVLPGNDVIECWRDGDFVASIYPHEDGLRVVSKYMTGVYKEKVSSPPAAIIKLKK